MYKEITATSAVEVQHCARHTLRAQLQIQNPHEMAETTSMLLLEYTGVTQHLTFSGFRFHMMKLQGHKITKHKIILLNMYNTFDCDLNPSGCVISVQMYTQHMWLRLYPH